MIHASTSLAFLMGLWCRAIHVSFYCFHNFLFYIWFFDVSDIYFDVGMQYKSLFFFPLKC